MRPRSNHITRKRVRLNHQFSKTRVRDNGFSVFRPAKTPDLDDVFDIASQELGDLVVRHRRTTGEKPMALSMLELEESKRQSALGGLATRQAIDLIYDEVRSLRKPFTATPADIRLIGRINSRALSFAIIFNEKTNDFINTERQQIHEVLESTAVLPLDFEWNEYYTPHLSLGHVLRNRRHEITASNYNAITESFPETIRLERGQFYDPCLQWVTPKPE
jgi:hypothetical protein